MPQSKMAAYNVYGSQNRIIAAKVITELDVNSFSRALL